MEMIAKVLGMPLGDLQFSLAGMHHFTWITAVEHAGVDKMPVVFGHLEEIPKLERIRN